MASFRILGPVEFRSPVNNAPGTTPPMLRGLLAALLLNAGEFVSYDRLAAMLWDAPPPSALDNLRGYAMRLRRMLVCAQFADRLVTRRRPGGYRLEVLTEELDSQLFVRLHTLGQAALRQGDPGKAARLLRSALALWRGSAGEDTPATGYLLTQFDALNERRIEAIEDAAEASLLLDRSPNLVPDLTALLNTHPLRERLWELLILARCRTGDWLGAMTDYRRLFRLLDDELGVYPSPRLQRLHQAVLRHDENTIRQVRVEPRILVEKN